MGSEGFASTDPASAEAMIAGLVRLGHCFHRRGVDGEQEAIARVWV